MTITDTDVINEAEIPETLRLLALKGRDIPIDPRRYVQDMPVRAIPLLDRLSDLNPHMRGELAEIEQDICSGALKTVKFGLNCLNRMVEHHNLRVAALHEKARRQARERAFMAEREMTRQRISVLPKHLRPAWLDA